MNILSVKECIDKYDLLYYCSFMEDLKGIYNVDANLYLFLTDNREIYEISKKELNNIPDILKYVYYNIYNKDDFYKERRLYNLQVINSLYVNFIYHMFYNNDYLLIEFHKAVKIIQENKFYNKTIKSILIENNIDEKIINEIYRLP